MNTKVACTKPEGRASSLTAFNLVVVISMLMLSGCATLFSTSEYPVYIDSVPPKMEIVVTDSDGDIVYRGKTPSVVNLDAGGGYFVRETYTVKLYDGSKVVGEREIENSIDGWYFANWFGATLIGFLVIDPITGAMWTLEDHVTVYKDVESTDTKQSLQLQIVDIDDIPESQRDGLIAIGPEDEPSPTSD